jgi:hypothetical protein
VNAKVAEIWAEMGSNVGIVTNKLRCGRRSWRVMTKCAEDYVANGLVWASKKAPWRQSGMHSGLRSCLRSGLPRGLWRSRLSCEWAPMWAKFVRDAKVCCGL